MDTRSASIGTPGGSAGREDKPAERSAGPNEEPRKDAPGNAEVQSAMDTHVEQGFHGEKVDERPDSDYTVEGVTGK